MGIYDREYYRDESGFHSWFSGMAPACRTIILVNVAVFILELFSQGPGGRGTSPLVEWLSANSPAILEHFQIWRLFTAPFVHSPHELLHIVFNMLFLYFLGKEMEAMLGSKEFALFYMAAAVFSTLVWALVDYAIPGGRSPLERFQGASGAILAIAVVYTLYYPNREVLLFFILPMRLWVLLVIFLSFDVLSLLQQYQGGSAVDGTRTGFAAHLAGALFGLLYKTLHWRIDGLIPSRMHAPRLRVVAPDRGPVARKAATIRTDASREARPSAPAAVTEDQLNSRLDEVLAKILNAGKDSLTDDEKQVLDEASRRARLRRSDRL